MDRKLDDGHSTIPDGPYTAIQPLHELLRLPKPKNTAASTLDVLKNSTQIPKLLRAIALGTPINSRLVH